MQTPGFQLDATKLLLVAIVLIGLALRLAALPESQESRDSDEIGYVSSGLVLLEGATPGYKFAPAGPLIWTVWTLASGKAAAALVAPSERAQRMPFHMRPLVAIEEALFDLYADMSGLLRALIVISLVLSSIAVAAMYELGRKRWGIAGATICGGLMAFTPLFIEFSVAPRPYTDAWSYAAIASAFAVIGPRNTVGLLACAAFMGLSIANRLDMLLFAPLIAWSLKFEAQRSRRDILAWVAATLVTLCLSAPWFFTDLIGNLRPVITVRLFSAGFSSSAAWHSGLRSLLLDQGLGVAVFGCLLAAAVAAARGGGRYKLLVTYLAMLFVSLVGGTKYGLRHQGATLLAVFWALPLLLSAAALRGTFRGVLVGATVILPLTQAVVHGTRLRAYSLPARATDYIEANIPPGSPVYMAASETRPPLPTPAASERLWNQVADVHAWRVKVGDAIERHGLQASAFPRALSEDHLAQERSNRRRWFILGSDVDVRRPRYDVWIVSGGSPFDVPPEGIAERLKATGGALIWRGRVLPSLEPAAAQWLAHDGVGTRVYVRPSPLVTAGHGTSIVSNQPAVQ